MKWNWGTGIAVVMALFVAFILYFVITMSTHKDFEHDLVTEEYYAKEMVYQQEIDAETNSSNPDFKITSKKVPAGWEITFPTMHEPSKIKGTVFLYRPSNKQLDKTFPLELSSHNLLIPDNSLLDGRWNITITYDYDGKPFMFKESINY